jgi:hypothetical protein
LNLEEKLMNNANFRRQVKRLSAVLVRTAPIALVSLLVWGLVPTAYASGCTAAALHGPYGISQTGSISGTGPVAVAGIIVFDGDGSMTGRVMVNLNGTSFPASPTATYTVDSDCTVTISLGDGETLFGAIVNNGRELQFINATPGFLGASGVAKKVAFD